MSVELILEAETCRIMLLFPYEDEARLWLLYEFSLCSEVTLPLRNMSAPPLWIKSAPPTPPPDPSITLKFLNDPCMCPGGLLAKLEDSESVRRRMDCFEDLLLGMVMG